MQENKVSNYEIMKAQMQAVFAAKNDLDRIAKIWRLEISEGALRVDFIGRTHYIDAETGETYYFEGGEKHGASYTAAMTLFDMLSRDREGVPAGEFSTVNSFCRVHTSSVLAGGMFDMTAQKFDHNEKRLAGACEKLGGVKFGKGEVSYRIPIFRELCVVLQFWSSDDEFGPSLHILCDNNMLDFMLYETMMYMLSYFLERITEEMDNA